MQHATVEGWSWQRKVMWGLLALMMCFLLGRPFVERLRPERTEIVDFYQEWSSARNVLTGRPVYLPIDETFAPYLNLVRTSDEPLYWDINVHPPTSVLLGIPFALLDYQNGMLAWNLASLLALVASGWLVARELSLKVTAWDALPIVSILLLCNPLWQQVTQGQLNLFLLLLLVGCWAAQRRGKYALAGTCLGLATAIKLFPGFLLLYFILRRQWRTALFAAGAGLAATLFTVGILGTETYADYVTQVLPRAVEWQSTWNNASLPGLWAKLFDPSQVHTQTIPLLRSAWLKQVATGVSWIVLVGLLARVTWQARSQAARDQAFGLAITAMLLLSPVTWEHYFLLLLLPLVLVWTRHPRPLSRSVVVVLLVFVLCWPIYLLCQILIPGGFAEGTAGPLMTLTLLSAQCYALIGLFILGYQATARTSAVTGDNSSTAGSSTAKSSTARVSVPTEQEASAEGLEGKPAAETEPVAGARALASRLPLGMLVLLLGASGLLWGTMPRWIYVGDAVAMRAGAINLLNRGRFDVPAEYATKAGERGQFYVEHTSNRLYYSKYGVFNSLLYVPPLLAERWTGGRLRYFDDLTPEQFSRRCFWLNCYNLALALALIVYLYWTARHFGASDGPAALYVALACFGTFLWYYFRAQTIEIFQLLFFTGAAYHLMRAYRLARGGPPRGAPLRHGWASMVFAGLLCLEKQVFVLLLPIIALFLAIALYRFGEEGWRPAAWTSCLRRTWPGGVTLLLGPPVAVLSLILLGNWFCFGSPFLTGYHQLESVEHVFTFRAGEIAQGLGGFLWDPQKSVFLYFPVLLVAAVFAPAFLRRHRFEYGFVLLTAALFYAVYSACVHWRGDWCYGPRYLLFLLPLLGLPALQLFRQTGAVRRWAAGLVVAGVLAWSAITQPLVQGVEFLSLFRIRDCFAAVEDERLANYFRRPFWYVNRDLIVYRAGRGEFPPLEMAKPKLNAEQVAALESRLRELPVVNIYWVPWTTSVANHKKDAKGRADEVSRTAATPTRPEAAPSGAAGAGDASGVRTGYLKRNEPPEPEKTARGASPAASRR